MKIRSFETAARRMWRDIPAEYREGVDGLVVSAAALPHPLHPDVYTLGECLTESYPSDFGGPDTIRSTVVLYHGSFRRLAALDPEFDWEDELWETLTHELRHHLEWLADEDALEAADYAAEEDFKRRDGEPFDPLFYRSGLEVAQGVWRIETDFFLEREWSAGELRPGDRCTFTWHGDRFEVPLPAQLGDACFLDVVAGVDAGPGGLTLVLVRRRGLLDSLRRLLSGGPADVRQAEVRATPVDDDAAPSGAAADPPLS